MVKNQGPRRSDEEWFRLINECRRSGLSDSLWCKQQGIPASSFFCAVRRLREKAYALPEREYSTDTICFMKDGTTEKVSEAASTYPGDKGMEYIADKVIECLN